MGKEGNTKVTVEGKMDKEQGENRECGKRAQNSYMGIIA